MSNGRRRHLARLALSMAAVLCGLVAAPVAPAYGLGATPSEAAPSTAPGPAGAEPAPDPAVARILSLLEGGQPAEAEEAARVHLAEIEASGGGDSPRAAEVLTLLAEAQWRRGEGKGPEASSAAERAITIREKTYGPEHRETLSTLARLGYASFTAGDYAVSRAFYQRALERRERTLPPDHLDVAHSLRSLAVVLNEEGIYAAARPLHERALAIRQSALGPDHPDVAQSLTDLGTLLQNLGEFTAARAHYERALSIQEKALGTEAPQVAETLTSLAGLLTTLGEMDRARSMYERALSIREKIQGPEHPDVAVLLNSFGLLLATRAEYERAQAAFERALAIWERAYGPEHPRIAAGLSNLGMVYRRKGDPAGAGALYERAIALMEKTLGAEHPDLSRLLNNLAIIRFETADFAPARVLFERALATLEKGVGPDHPDVGSVLGNLAQTLHELGDYAGERSSNERSLGILEKALGPEALEVARASNNLAALLLDLKDVAAALPVAQRAAATYEKAVGPVHPDLAASLNTYASALAASGDAPGARKTLERSIAMWQRIAGPSSPWLARDLAALAGLYLDEGDFARARPLAESALEMRLETLGAMHPDAADSLLTLARALWGVGSTTPAFGAAVHAESIVRRQFQEVARGLAEREALRLERMRISGLDLGLSILSLTPALRDSADAVSKAWDELARSRGMVLDEMATRHRGGLDEGTPETRELHRALQSASVHLARTLVAGPQADSLARYAEDLHEAQQEKDEAESALAAASAVFRDQLAATRIGLFDVSRALPEGSALLAYAQYERQSRPTTAPAAGSGRASVPSYLAFVLRSGDLRPVLVPLASAEEIDTQVARWRREAGAAPGALARRGGRAEARYRQSAEALRRLAWDPVQPHISDRRLLFVVPDGALGLVNFASLPTQDGGYLLERGPLIHYLSAERDLLPVRVKAPPGKGLLIVGDPDFNARPLPLDAALARIAGATPPAPPAAESSRPPSPVPARATVHRGKRAACASFRSLKFSSLPGARREVQDLEGAWREKQVMKEEEQVRALVGADASEASFKIMAPGRRIVHLATHGFFLEGSCPSALGVPRPPQHAPATAGAGDPLTLGENPLLLSGLALAGANRRDEAGPDDEDGVLTGEEIAALDLSGVDWVVLSACETGIGQVQTGEGVLGLRRAFEVSGAGTLVMSLWAVDDEATRAWMRELYAAHLSGQSAVESVRQAGLRILESRRKAGLSTHPFHWAAFVAAGDWR